MTGYKAEPRPGGREKLKSAFMIGSGAALAAMVASKLIAGQLDGELQATALGLGGVAAAIALGCAIGWIATLDELAQRAHYVAWYWGGSVGLAAAGAILLYAGFSPASVAESWLLDWWGPSSAKAGFLTGALTAMVLPVLGYNIWWLAFWLRRR